MKSDNKLLSMPMGKLVWNISFPLMLALLIQSLYNIVDGIFVAKISENALAATSLAYPIQMLMIALSVGTGVGLNACLSRFLGQKKSEEAAKAAGTGLFAGIMGWLIFLIFAWVGADWFISLYTSDPQIFADTKVYLQICCSLSFGIFIAVIGERMLQATGKTWLSMAAEAVGAITNIVLDPVLIFGLVGFPAMGIAGAAVATITGQILSSVTALVLNYTMNKQVKMGFRYLKPDGSMLKTIFKVGIPTSVMQACGSIMTVSMNGILNAYSMSAVAFFGIYYKLQNFLYMPLNGLAQSLIPIVGFNLGAKQPERITSAYRIAIKSAICFMLAGTLVFWLFCGILLELFSATETMLVWGKTALRIISCGFVLTGCTVVTGYFFTGLQNGVVNMVSALLRQIVILLPCAWLFSSLFGLQGIWYAFWIAELAAFFWAMFSYRSWRKKNPA